MPTSPPMDSPTVLRRLRRLRGARAALVFSLSVPTVGTGLLVLVNKLTHGGLHFLVSGAPWTHWFWSALFFLLLVGAILSVVVLAWPCPRCGNNFFRRRDYDPHHPPVSLGQTGTRWNINCFSSRCLNCGLSIDGANLDMPPGE
ncbi:MAG: hypothetical protein U1F66_02680 [bacterium]